jgi:ABC-type antimicrobial peptide transport system permease subunit
LTFIVIGVLNEKVSTHGLSEIQEDSVFIPLPLMKYFKGQDVLSTLFAQASGPDQVESLKRQMILLLNSRHPTDAHYSVQTLTAVLRASKMISFALTVVLLIIALITILVGVAGIMSGLRSLSALRPIRREV